jgi:hypothetical protein
MVDIQTLDLGDRCLADGPSDCARLDRLGQLAALLGLHALRIVETGKHERAIRDHAGRNDGPGKRSPADFVDAADQLEAAFARGPFVRVETHEPASFSLSR